MGLGKELQVGACLRSPPGPLVADGMGWDKGRGSEHGQKGAGLGDSERPRLKVWLPLNSGLFGIQLKAKGGGSPMGGEVTGIGRGGIGLLEPAPPTSPPRPGLHPNPGNSEGRVPHSSPPCLQARHPAAASRQKGKTNKTEREGGRRGR